MQTEHHSRSRPHPAQLSATAEGYGIRGLHIELCRRAGSLHVPHACGHGDEEIPAWRAHCHPYEMHPLKIANAVATLNEASGSGMVVIGGGGQWPRARHEIRQARDGRGEAIGMVKRAVSGQPVNWDGEVTAPATSAPPGAKGRPAIVYAGATGPNMLDMAVRLRRRHDVQRHHGADAAAAMATIRASLAREKRDARSFLVNNLRVPRQGRPEAPSARPAAS